MKLRPPSLNTVLLLSFSLFACWGCSGIPHETIPSQEDLIQSETDMAAAEKVDTSCSYFYFLWATHAENNKRFNEAEEAYEKALICDPESRYILRRLPILLIRMEKPYAAAQLLRNTVKMYPDKIQDKLLLARLDIRSGEIEEAIALYSEVIKLNPEDETILLRLGFLHSQHNQYQEAEQAFNQALLLNPDSLFAHLYLARLAVQTGRHDQAEEWYRQALELNWSVELAFEVADFYSTQDAYENVAQQYRSILKKWPDDEMAGMGLVHTLLLQDNETAAFEELKRMRGISAEPNRIDIITARLYLRSEKLDKASELLEPVALQENEPEAAYMLAVIHYQREKFEPAMALLKTIRQESDQYEDSIYLQVQILLNQKQQQQAIPLLTRTLADITPASPGLYTLLASLYVEQGQLQQGYDVLDKAIAEYPDNPDIYFEYGLLLEEDDKQEQAITSMEKVLALEPDHAEALNYIGYTWADNNTNLEQALLHIQRAMELKPGNGYIQDSLGWVYFRMGKLSQAKIELLKALDLEPQDPHIYDHLGDIYREQGETRKASETYRKAKELFPHQEQKSRMQEKLNGLE